MGSLVRKSGPASCQSRWCLTHGPHRVFGASRFRLSHSVYFTPVEKGRYNVAKATVETSLCPRWGVGWDEGCDHDLLLGSGSVLTEAVDV